MNKEDIFCEVGKICKEVFDDPALIISKSTSAGNVEKWDSMTNLFLIDTIEKIFQIKFSLDEILNAQNVGDLCDIIEQKKS